MRFDVVTNPGSLHQNAAGRALIAGFKRHGIQTRLCIDGREVDSRWVATWGWRNARPHVELGRQVLVIELAYVGDRFAWFSLGWNGLNGHATFPKRDDPARWREHFGHLMRPWHGGRYALLLGQVCSDQSVAHVNYLEWVYEAVEAITARGWPVLWRPHPNAPQEIPAPCERIYGELDEALSGAGLAVAYNSNSAVDAVLAGTPTLVCDAGAMAWPVAGHGLEAVPFDGDRQGWANRLAWCQWLPREIESGEAWDNLKEVMPACAQVA